MRDDDDDHEPGKGKIYYSGINPGADRADYALPAGQPALQDGDVEFEVESRGGWSRRGWLGLAAGAGFAGTIGFLAGSFAANGPAEASSPPRPTRSGRVQWLIDGARSAARGPLENLVASYGTFVMVVEEYEPADPVLWEGIEKLGGFALLDRGEKGARIARRLLGAFASVAPPPHLVRMKVELEEFVLWHERSRKK